MLHLGSVRHRSHTAASSGQVPIWGARPSCSHSAGKPHHTTPHPATLQCSYTAPSYTAASSGRVPIWGAGPPSSPLSSSWPGGLMVISPRRVTSSVGSAACAARSRICCAQTHTHTHMHALTDTQALLHTCVSIHTKKPTRASVLSLARVERGAGTGGRRVTSPWSLDLVSTLCGPTPQPRVNPHRSPVWTHTSAPCKPSSQPRVDPHLSPMWTLISAPCGPSSQPHVDPHLSPVWTLISAPPFIQPPYCQRAHTQ